MRIRQLKMATSRPFWILFLQNLSWVILVLHLVKYSWYSYELRKLLTKLLKFKMTAIKLLINISLLVA